MPSATGLLTSKFREVLQGVSGSKSRILDPDEKWSNLHREREKNNLYKWVDLKAGGELVQIFETAGEHGIVKFGHQRIKPLLYNEGERMERIKLADYMKYKNDQRINLAGNDNDSFAIDLDGEKFEEHDAQWRLNRRGVEGETVLHLLYSRDDPRAVEIARILVRQFPGLAFDIYEGDDKYGQSCLHLAIIHDDFEAVSFLLAQNVPVNQRARGRFFLPEDQKLKNPAPKTNYVGYAYYGEYPLAFAASFGNKDIYDIIISRGGDPNLQDSFGNTILHICVINNSIEMYSYAVRHFEKPANVDILNGAGYTPLTLASKLGRKEIFDAMLDLMKVEFWRFSDMACSAYPLTALDTVKPDGSTNWESALMTIINGNTDEHLEMIDSEIIQRLISEKMKAFARNKLLLRFGLLILHVFTMSVAIYLRPTPVLMQDVYDCVYTNATHDTSMNCTTWINNSIRPENMTYYRDYIQRDNTTTGELDTYAKVRFSFKIIAEVGLCLQCVAFLFYQQGSEIRSQGIHGFLRNLQSDMTKVIFIVANVLILCCIVLRAQDDEVSEDVLLAIALPCSWVFFLFFARSILLTGPFVQMIYRMIYGDMVRFAIIALIFLLSYSQAFFFVGKDMENIRLLKQYSITAKSGEHDNAEVEQCEITDSITNYRDFLETMVTMFRAMMGGYDYEEFNCAQYSALTKIMFILYLITMPIMLINMLIAMMGNTYTTVINQAEKAWRKNVAQITIVLERSIKPEKLIKAQLEYSIKLADARDGVMETRGLMVIKQTKKTGARQRKEAISNWKRLGRALIKRINVDGMEKTQRLLHNSNRTATPTLLLDNHFESNNYHLQIHPANVKNREPLALKSNASLDSAVNAESLTAELQRIATAEARKRSATMDSKATMITSLNTPTMENQGGGSRVSLRESSTKRTSLGGGDSNPKPSIGSGSGNSVSSLQKTQLGMQWKPSKPVAVEHLDEDDFYIEEIRQPIMPNVPMTAKRRHSSKLATRLSLSQSPSPTGQLLRQTERRARTLKHKSARAAEAQKAATKTDGSNSRTV